MVNGIEDPAALGTILPRDQAELDQFSALVRSAVGYDETRGDVVTVQSMAFTSPVPQGSGPITASFFNVAIDLMTLLQMAILAIVILVIALFVIKPILRPTFAPTLPALAPPPETNTLSESDDSLEGEISFEPSAKGVITTYNETNNKENTRSVAFSIDNHGDAPVQRLREMIEMRQDETIDILRQWLEQKEKKSS